MYIIYEKNDPTKWHDQEGKLHDSETQGIFEYELNNEQRKHPSFFVVNGKRNGLLGYAVKARNWCIDLLVQKHHDKKNELLGNPTSLDIASWSSKMSDVNGERVGVAKEALKVGETVDDLVGKILTNNARYVKINAQLDGIKRKCIKDLEKEWRWYRLTRILSPYLAEIEKYNPDEL